MPRLEYFLVAEATSVDQGTNKISIFNVIEELRSPQWPATVPVMTAVGALEASEEDKGKEFQAIVRVSGDALSEPRDFPLNFELNTKRQRLLFRINALRVERPGAIVVSLLLNGQHLAEHRVVTETARAGEQ